MSMPLQDDERSRGGSSVGESSYASSGFGDEQSTDDDKSLDDSSVSDEFTADGSVPLQVQFSSKKNKQKSLFARKETRIVQFSRCIIVLMLFGSAVISSYFTFTTLTQQQQEDFHNQFSDDANILLARSYEKIYMNLDFLMQLSVTLTSSSSNLRNPANRLPYFTLNDFELLGQQYAKLSGSLIVGYTPLLIGDNDRYKWEEYALEAAQEWMQNGLSTMDGDNDDDGTKVIPQSITPYIYQKVDNLNGSSATESRVPEEDGLGSYSPIWQTSPPPTDINNVNFNLFNDATFKKLVESTNTTREAAISDIFFDVDQYLYSNRSSTAPKVMIVAPVIDDNMIPINESRTVAHAISIVPWMLFLEDILEEGHNGIIVVLTESCGGVYTFRIDGSNASYLGAKDMHDDKYNALSESKVFSNTKTASQKSCAYNITVYPSEVVEDTYTSNQPRHYMLGVLAMFLFTSLMFLLYDAVVQYRQSKIMAIATKTSSIVTSLFPAQVRDQLFGRLSTYMPRSPSLYGTSFPSPDESEHKKSKKKKRKKKKKRGSPEVDIPKNTDVIDLNSKPIADLFPSATVLFGDIAGFTAWSSTREPTHVFVLLETIYNAFDQIAKQRRVFKVETIGDCYVAVVGLPDPCKDHATVMSKFARDILAKLSVLTRKLESTLGPDTGDLAMRIGLHSGPVTAGVLRGERARFQLFGDTVNTAARMESTGSIGKIQVSQQTADLIIAAGKANWLEQREDIVHAKGKGDLQTYWLKPKKDALFSGSASYASSIDSGEDEEEDDFEVSTDFMGTGMETEMSKTSSSHKTQRLIDWTTDTLLKLLQRVVATRAINGVQNSFSDNNLSELETSTAQIGNCMQDVVEVISLPKYDAAIYAVDPENTKLNDDVVRQLRSYVSLIASMYKQNPFHNFEHASHVIMSTVKLLSRIVVPTSELKEGEDGKICKKDLHDYSYGITSDPLTQFAVVFSALIHDVDHKGVPNFVLCKEDSILAAVYKEKSVAEQNSVDISWSLLMGEGFEDLRRAIYSTEDEMRRFRLLVVNSVIATDIFDKDLSALRKDRWDKAFNGNESECTDTSRCRKATIVIEHLIQASDVSHTMQHWHVYQKWNERLYREMYEAYTAGRPSSGVASKDPADGWYQGELWFFDNYVIPLAKKLDECGVFGVSSDEYRNYAENNRYEWERKGKDIVARMRRKYGGHHDIESDMRELANLDRTLRTFSQSKRNLMS